MSTRKTSGETAIKIVKLQGWGPEKSKKFDNVKKMEKSYVKDAISDLGSAMVLMIAIADEPSDKPKSRKHIKAATGYSYERVDEWLGRLERAGMINAVSDGWLVNSESLASGMIESLTRANTRKKVIASLEELREENFVDITLYDVCRKTHLASGVIEDDVYLLAEDYGLAVAAEASWNYELQPGEHLLDVISAHSLRKELSKVDPKSRVK